ncbi:hypothetical protein BHE74_00003870 [Ensete ventricosum]|nr:hypothetical protein GW17_00028373 [Ensete ventricosum]RWW87308.1 hypothetical protein BHE74_00003870 [Ensete ventricosum]RZR82569.1 hypothetical protein BHM03_00009019 [Ensete ventricosum]
MVLVGAYRAPRREDIVDWTSSFSRRCVRNLLWSFCTIRIVYLSDLVLKANPVEYGHIFLVPYDVHQMPQFLDKGVLGLMSQITAEVANRSFHIFFDYDASRSLDHKCFQVIILLNLV